MQQLSMLLQQFTKVVEFSAEGAGVKREVKEVEEETVQVVEAEEVVAAEVVVEAEVVMVAEEEVRGKGRERVEVGALCK